MKITTKMIDKQLRIPAKIINMIIKSPSESKFRRLQKNSIKLRGKRFKGLDCSEKWITRSKDNTPMRICIYKPLINSIEAPGVLWMHGGGYAIGVPETSIGLIKKLIDESGCVIVAPDYRSSFDLPYPAALEDCHEALLWMKEHANNLGIRDDQIMVGGESAGGGLAAGLCLFERDNKGVNIAFQMPLYPMLDDRMMTKSAKNNNAPVWNSESNKIAWGLYLGDLIDDDVPYYAAPARAKDLSNLPPAVTFVGSLEPFRDETIIYMEKLKDAGIPVTYKVYEGCYHAFNMYPYADVSKKAITFLIESFKYAIDNYFAKQNV